MDADYPLAGRTMDQLYGMAGPPQGEEQAPLYPQGRAGVDTPSLLRKFCLKKGGGWRTIFLAQKIF